MAGSWLHKRTLVPSLPRAGQCRTCAAADQPVAPGPWPIDLEGIKQPVDWCAEADCFKQNTVNVLGQCY